METSTVTGDIIETSNQFVHMVLDPGITNFLAVLCIVILIALPAVLVWLAYKYHKPATKAADSLETIAEKTEQHAEDHKIIKEKVSKTCQGIEVLKELNRRSGE